jgi:hypothetical protein
MALPDFSTPFTLETDANGTGICIVLMQRGKPIAYYNRTIGRRAAAMSTYDKEALAILEALKRWRHYFLGSELVIKTDQKSLKFITEQKVAEGIQHKLLLKLLEFNYTIEYKKGKENKAADALSRRDSSLMAITVIQPAWIEAVLASYQQDTHCHELLQRLAIALDHDNHYTLHVGILRYINRVYIGNDPDLKIQLLGSFHASALGGHSGMVATY